MDASRTRRRGGESQGHEREGRYGSGPHKPPTWLGHPRDLGAIGETG